MAKAPKEEKRNGFEVYKGVHAGNHGWYWRLWKQGQIVADGAESYTRRPDALRAVRAIKKHASTADVRVTESE